MKKRTIILVCLSLLMIGTSLAFFTDAASFNKDGSVATLDITIDYTQTSIDLMKPGDARTLVYRTKNLSTIDTEIRDYIAISFIGNSEEDLYEKLYEKLEDSPYEVYRKDDVISYSEESGYVLKEGATPIAGELITKQPGTFEHPTQSQVYYLGSENLVVDGSRTREVVLIAKSEYSKAMLDFTVEYIVEAKQKNNTWEEVETEKIYFGSHNKKVVPTEYEANSSLFTYSEKEDGTLMIHGFAEINSPDAIEGSILVLPSSHEGKAVTEVAGHSFMINSSKFTTLIIPDSIVAIRSQSFRGTNFKVIQFGKGLKTIEYYAFWGAPVEEVILPEGVEEVGSSAFYNSTVKKLVLPSTLKIAEERFVESENLRYIELSVDNLDFDFYRFKLPYIMEDRGRGTFIIHDSKGIIPTDEQARAEFLATYFGLGEYESTLWDITIK